MNSISTSLLPVFIAVFGLLFLTDLSAQDAEKLKLAGAILKGGEAVENQEVELVGENFRETTRTDAEGNFVFPMVPQGLQVKLLIRSQDDATLGWSTRPFYFEPSENGYLIQDAQKQRKTSTRKLEIDVRGAGGVDFEAKPSNQSLQLLGGGAIRISGGSIVAGQNAGGARISGKGTVEAGTLRWVLQ